MYLLNISARTRQRAQSTKMRICHRLECGAGYPSCGKRWEPPLHLKSTLYHLARLQDWHAVPIKVCFAHAA